jgi:hypothetical protein
MRVNTQHYLQPTSQNAHSVTVEDRLGNVIYAAIEFDNGQIITAQIGDPDFPEILKALGVEKVGAKIDITPKPIAEMKRLL